MIMTDDQTNKVDKIVFSRYFSIFPGKVLTATFNLNGLNIYQQGYFIAGDNLSAHKLCK